MANNVRGIKMKDNTCPEEQMMQKSKTDKTSPMERPKGGLGSMPKIGIVLSLACTTFVWRAWSTWCLWVSRSLKEGKWNKCGNRDLRRDSDSYFSPPRRVALTVISTQVKPISAQARLGPLTHFSWGWTTARKTVADSWGQKERKQMALSWDGKVAGPAQSPL